MRLRIKWAKILALIAIAIIAIASASVFQCRGDRVSAQSSSPQPAACAAGETQKTTICHVPPGYPERAQTQCVATSAVKSHIANHPEDSVGGCPCASGGDRRLATASDTRARRLPIRREADERRDRADAATHRGKHGFAALEAGHQQFARLLTEPDPGGARRSATLCDGHAPPAVGRGGYELPAPGRGDTAGVSTDDARIQARTSGDVQTLSRIFADDYTLVTAEDALRTKENQLGELRSGQPRGSAFGHHRPLEGPSGL